jgi:hypothetical protein
VQVQPGLALPPRLKDRGVEHAVPPEWLTWLARCCLVVSVVCAAGILFDVYARKHRQQMRIMEAVWPVTALYLGPLAVWGYRRFGLPRSRLWLREKGLDEAPAQPGWAGTALGVTHCGAGCTLGDLIAEFAVFAAGWQIAGRALWPEYVGDYVLAVALGVLFQYFAIAPMRGLSFRKGIIAAVKADVLSLTAFEVGLFGWMALMSFVFFSGPHLHPDTAAYWFLMQIGMIIGAATAYPMNSWLIRRGIKEAM